MTEVISDVCVRIAQAFCFEPEETSGVTLWEACANGVCPTDPGADIIGLIPKAACGEISAQREIAERATVTALSCDPNCDPVIVLSEGLMFARMAESHGCGEDAFRTIAMLSLASLLSAGDGATNFAAEAIARLELLADAGNEHSESAAELLAKCAANEAPETLELAKDYRKRITTACADFLAAMRAAERAAEEVFDKIDSPKGEE